MSREKLSIAKKIWIGIGAFAVAACVFAIISSVTFPNFSRIYHLDEKMIDAIRPDGTLVMTDATNFEWDEMWVMTTNYSNLTTFAYGMGIELPDHETGEMEYWMCFLKDKKLVKSYQNNLGVLVMIYEKSFYCGVDEDGHVRDWIWCFLPETAVFDTVIENGQLLLTPLFPAEE